MGIEDGTSVDQLERFRRRIAEEATEHGRLVGVYYGEQFRAIRDL